MKTYRNSTVVIMLT